MTRTTYTDRRTEDMYRVRRVAFAFGCNFPLPISHCLVTSRGATSLLLIAAFTTCPSLVEYPFLFHRSQPTNMSAVTAAAQKKLDAKIEEKLREICRRTENKRCMDCLEKGPRYVVLNFNIFVCSTCSGIHREFQHRALGVSMSKFTMEQVKELDKGGNKVARKVYMAKWNPSDFPEPESNNKAQIREFIKKKYIEKAWFKKKKKSKDKDKNEEPTEDLSKEERRARRRASRKEKSESIDDQFEGMAVSKSTKSAPVAANDDLFGFDFTASAPEPQIQQQSSAFGGGNDEAFGDFSNSADTSDTFAAFGGSAPVPSTSNLPSDLGGGMGFMSFGTGPSPAPAESAPAISSNPDKAPGGMDVFDAFSDLVTEDLTAQKNQVAAANIAFGGATQGNPFGGSPQQQPQQAPQQFGGAAGNPFGGGGFGGLGPSQQQGNGQNAMYQGHEGGQTFPGNSQQQAGHMYPGQPHQQQSGQMYPGQPQQQQESYRTPGPQMNAQFQQQQQPNMGGGYGQNFGHFNTQMFNASGSGQPPQQQQAPQMQQHAPQMQQHAPQMQQHAPQMQQHAPQMQRQAQAPPQMQPQQGNFPGQQQMYPPQGMPQYQQQAPQQQQQAPPPASSGNPFDMF